MLFAFACGGEGAAPRPTQPATAPLATRTTAEPTATAAPGGSAAVQDEPVAFMTTDGVTVHGHFYSTPGPRRQVVVLAHEFPRDQTAWRDFARELAAQGIAALTFDFRGYGETGGARDVSKIDLDLEAAVRFVKSRDYPLVFVIGASMGGTAALKVAARQELTGVATLSAPLQIMGLDARPDLANIRERKLFVAGRRDEGGVYAAAVAAMLEASPEPKQAQVYEDAAEHGTELLRGANAPAVKALLLGFVR